jgi:hypothetical protein
MKTTTLLASLAVVAASLAALVATCSRPPARKPAHAAVSLVAAVPSARVEARQQVDATPLTVTSRPGEERPAPHSICDCTDGSVCVENAPMPPTSGSNPGECRATPPSSGKVCQGLQVFDEICGGCVPSPCAGRCRQQGRTSSGLCQVRPEGCDPLNCECFNPCAPLRCNVVGTPSHIRCTRD